ncbi:MAG: Ada metal-binding domain-containing protein [Woeseiaceae bacterium]|nr:Ada metal-binding domain-containing protein [Woeseiaceae bacterium]
MFAAAEQKRFERARLSRDARFDGRFFVGVKTTGIYCRPICPANAPKRENIEFYPSAAAASEAGLRPCLRCRPETAPGTPAWLGTSTTVRRGLRLIESGALDNDGVDTLADRLGVTSRHLRRLFQKHLGASPLSVANTQRLHFAKRLIDQTNLPLREVAFAAGYRSVRRFNDEFLKTYQRSPRELRAKQRHRDTDTDGDALTVRLRYREPFDWQQALGFFVFRATPGVESVGSREYARSIRHAGVSGLIVVRHNEPGSLSVSIQGVPTSAIFPVVQRARSMFDVDAPVAEIEACLARDPALASRLPGARGIRVPGVWNGFELAVRAILGQQVSVAAATTMAGRVAERYGDAVHVDGHAAITRHFPEPERLMRARFNDMGLIGSRIQSIRELARAVENGDLSLNEDADPAETRRELVKIRGIGDWTAQYIAMRALKDPDAFPASDLGLLRAFDSSLGRRIKPAELENLSEAWRPWRAYAALLLWRTSTGG